MRTMKPTTREIFKGLHREYRAEKWYSSQEAAFAAAQDMAAMGLTHWRDSLEYGFVSLNLADRCRSEYARLLPEEPKYGLKSDAARTYARTARTDLMSARRIPGPKLP